jgi:GntR family galactonate operon transcriptional repressor
MAVRTTKTERLIRSFGKDIASGAYEAGSALPSEAELCEKFDASRNVMREVVKVLATKRLIDAQHYRGLFVMPRSNWNYLDADVLEWALEPGDNPELISSLIEVRSLIEPTISRWAAERATAVDLVAIEAALNGMVESRHDRALFMEADIRFHRAVVLATHNVVIQQLSDAISALQRAIFDHTFQSDAKSLRETVEQHARLFETIRLRNPTAAAQACADMVTRTAHRNWTAPRVTGGRTTQTRRKSRKTVP